MKDKICFNKNLLFFVFIVLVIVSIFYLFNYINSNKLSVNSRAAFLNGGGPTPTETPSTTPPQFSYNTVTTDAENFITKVQPLVTGTLTRSATLDTQALQHSLTTLKSDIDSIGSAYLVVETNFASLKTLADQALKTSNINLSNAQRVVTTANSNVVSAQTAFNNANTALITSQRNVKNDITAMIIILSNKSSDKNTPALITRLKNVEKSLDIQELQSIEVDLKSNPPYSGHNANFNTIASSFNSDVPTLSTSLSSFQKADQDLKNKNSLLLTAQQQLGVLNTITADITDKTKELNSLIVSKDSPLPNSVDTISLPTPTYAVDTQILTNLNNKIDAFDQSLPNAYGTYNTLSDDVAKANTDYNTQIRTYTNYCSGIKYGTAGYSPILDQNGSPLDVSQQYYNDFCGQNKTSYGWNGKYGTNAICYTATGLCSKSSICNKISCISNIGNNIACLNQPVSAVDVPVVQGGLSCEDKYLAIGIDILQKNVNCPPNSSKIAYYKTTSNNVDTYYEEQGLVQTNTSTGKKICVDKSLSDNSDILKAKSYLNDLLTNKQTALKCYNNNSIGWYGGNNSGKGLSITNTDGTVVTSQAYDTCLRLNGQSNLAGTACINQEISAGYCNCADAGFTYMDNNGVYKNMGSNLYGVIKLFRPNKTTNGYDLCPFTIQ